MTKKEITELLEKCGYKNDKGATQIGQYSDNATAQSLTKQQVGNRNSTGWCKAEYVVIEHGEGDFNLEKVLKGWKELTKNYRNQFLILEVERGRWKMYDYDCKEIKGRIEDILAGYNGSDKTIQKIFFGSPGTGKSHKVNIIIEDNRTKRAIRFNNYLKKNGHSQASIDKYSRVLSTAWIISYAHIYNGGISDLYDIDESNTVAKIAEAVAGDQQDIVGKHMYSCALKHYSDMLKNQTVFRTTFHPDTDYASFVGCYKPQVDKSNNITYKFRQQIFTEAYVTAWKNRETPIYLVIEEINRGNCAQIFGDLFQLLDRKDGFSEYQIKADNDLADYIESELGVGAKGIENRKLCLPPNFNILATMNTSDQSLFPMDSAFKRRWDWEYIPIDPKCPYSDFEIDIDGKKYRWADFTVQVNERILKLSESEDKQLGNFFIKGNIDKDQFKSKVMFYLWSEICKDHYNSDSFFKYKDGSNDVEFTFNKLYAEDDARILQGFMENLGVKEI